MRQIVVTLVFVLFCLLVWADLSHAADTCGAGRTGDSTCTGLYDADADGYATNSDYDDTKGRGPTAVIPGVLVADDCSAGSFKAVQTDGTLGSCASLNSATTFFVDFANGDDSNDGTAPTDEGGGTGPWKCPNMFGYWYNNRPATSRNPVAGDTLYIRSGTYDSNCVIDNGGNYDDHFMVFRLEDASAESPITITNYPGEYPIFDDDADALGNAHIYVYQSDNIKISGIELTGGANVGVGGIHIKESGNIELSRMKIHDIDLGSCGNMAGIMIEGNPYSGTNEHDIHHNYIYDVYDAESNSDRDCSSIITFLNEVDLLYNTIEQTNSYGGRGFFQKNPPTDTTMMYVRGNHFIGTGEVAVQIAHSNVTVDNNVFSGCAGAVRSLDEGAGAYYAGCTAFILSNNTAIGGSGPFYRIGELQDWSCALTGTSFTLTNNVWHANTTYNTTARNQYMTFDWYGTAGEESDLMPNFSISGNCYYNAGTGDYWSEFGDTYASISLWQATGYESGSYNEDSGISLPQLTTSAANCSNAGWRVEYDYLAGSAPSGSTWAVPSAVNPHGPASEVGM